MRRLAIAVLLVLFLLSSAVPVTLAVPGASSAEAPLEFNPGLEENDDNFDIFSQTIVLRSNPLKHVVADLNNDGRNDLAIIYHDSIVLDIFLAGASNNFTSVPSQTVTFLWQPTGLTAGDMDDDGEMDLIISLDYDGPKNIAICYQKNDFSSVEPQAKYLDGSNKQKGVLVSDLNGDGLLDVIALNSMDDAMVTAGFFVYRSIAPNTYGFTAVLLSDMHFPDLMVMGDLNGDGRQDLVIGDRTAKMVVCFRNDLPTATLWTRIAPINDVMATALLVEQASGDNREELFIALASNPPNTMVPVIRVLRYSNQTSSVSDLVDEIPNQPQVTWLTMVMNSIDGRMDLVRTSSYLHNLTIFNTPAINPMWRYSDSISSPTPAEPISVLSSDMNTDGLSDLVVLCNSSAAGILTIYYHSGTAISNANDNLVVTEANLKLTTVGDLNGDGSQELAFYDGTARKIVFYNVTNGRFDDLPALAGAVALEAEDLNGDGKDDLVLANATVVNIWWGSSTFFSSGASITMAASMTPRSIGFGDLDGDGNEELIIGCLGGLEVYWNDGSVSPFSVDHRFVLTLPGSDALAVQTGFFSGDGDALVDIAIINATADRVEIYYQQPSSPEFSSTSRMLLTVVPNSDDLVGGDLNGDGRQDLATHSDNALYLFLQYPGGFFGAPEFPTKIVPGQGIDGLATGNLDDLGIVELVLLSENSTVLALSYDTVHAIFVPLTVQTVGAAPGKLIVADLDRDGKDDLAVHSYTSRSTSVFYQNNFPPFARANLEGTGHLEGDEVWFNADGTTDSLSDQDSLAYVWDFGDGTFGIGNRTGHEFLNNGTYNVVLNVTDQLRAFTTVTIVVIIGDQAPIAGFNHFGMLVEGNAISFTDLSTSPADDMVSWRWNFGDGEWSNQTSGAAVQHIYDRNGTYAVTLTVTDEDGSQDSMSLNITLLDSSPIADLSASSYSPIEGQEVTLIDRTEFTADAVVGWSWNLGDGTWVNWTQANRPSDGTIQHTYVNNGTYQVTLKVRDIDGSEDSVTKQIVVLNSVPLASFSTSLASPLEGEEVTFTDTSNFPVNEIVSWSWDLGDGTLVNMSGSGSVHHTYVTSGTYQITLTVTDADGDEAVASKQLVVRNSAPLAGFSISNTLPLEGDLLSFTDTSSVTINPIAKWSWDLGDGTWVNWTQANRPSEGKVQHTYADNGTYRVRLTVTDADGDINATSMTLAVGDTGPTVSQLTTEAGSISYKEWDDVVLEVEATPRWNAILRYQWDFQTVAFQADMETDVNSTSHRYNSSGTFLITVRAWDHDSFTEASLLITITDPAPVPDFEYATNAVNRTVIFSAERTIDTENEILEYRWFFGDNQQTTWSRDDRTNHTYSDDGIYSVRLEVKDDHNPAVIKTRNVTIDLLPPVISMDDPVLKAVVGEPALIRVTVTDLVGIGSVRLEYTIGNTTRTVSMTHEGGGVYFAQIPAQNSTMELTYRIIAEDMAGHEAFTENFTLALEYEDPSLFIYTSLALLIAFLVIIIYLFLSRPIVDEVFVLYHDGTLLAHQTRRLKPGMDDEILGGMLIALQNFVRDSFKDENSTVLRRMDFGERKLLVERKDDFFMAVMLSGKRAGNAATRMMKVLDSIEEGYAPVLKEWDGDLEKVRGIRDETKPMFSRANPLDRLKRKEGEDDSI